MILEYGVPRSGCTAIRDWAEQWHNLGSLALGTVAFNDALQKITDEFSGPNAAPTNPNGSALEPAANERGRSQWSMGIARVPSRPDITSVFIEAPVVQTPDLRFNLTYILNDYMDNAEAAILAHSITCRIFFGRRPSWVEMHRTISCSFGTAGGGKFKPGAAFIFAVNLQRMSWPRD